MYYNNIVINELLFNVKLAVGWNVFTYTKFKQLMCWKLDQFSFMYKCCTNYVFLKEWLFCVDKTVIPTRNEITIVIPNLFCKVCDKYNLNWRQNSTSYYDGAFNMLQWFVKGLRSLQGRPQEFVKGRAIGRYLVTSVGGLNIFVLFISVNIHF